MGIDIYASWSGMTEAQKKAQFTGFSLVHGHTGYIRESYHGEPYPSETLVKEAFDSETQEALIPAKIMRERLEHVLALAEVRMRTIYDVTDEADLEEYKNSYENFVLLCEHKEKETGKPCTIIASY